MNLQEEPAHMQEKLSVLAAAENARGFSCGAIHHRTGHHCQSCAACPAPLLNCLLNGAASRCVLVHVHMRAYARAHARC